MPAAPTTRQLERVAALLGPLADVIEERVEQPEPPAWAERRGWSAFLLSLDDDELARAEIAGLASLRSRLADAPADLQAICAEAEALCAPLRRGPRDLAPLEKQHVPLRKRAQVAALVDRLRQRVSGVERIVDVGAGHGHLTRALWSELGISACGVDHDLARVRVARRLVQGRAIAFIHGTLDERLPLSSRDLLLGLHACGRLGDAVVARAAAARCEVVLVSCCLQKIDQAGREPLSDAGRRLGVAWPRARLGLSNLSWGSGAEASMRGRELRYAVRLVLASRGIMVAPGDEAHGINKRRFRQSLRGVAAAALAQRGQPPPSDDELAEGSRRGRREFARIRRLSLPRNLLGRLMELSVVLDRACYLEERGFTARVEPMFDVDVSPRNLGVVAFPARSITARAR